MVNIVSEVQKVIDVDVEGALSFIYKAVENRLEDLGQAPLMVERTFNVAADPDVYCDPSLGGHYEDSNDPNDIIGSRLC